MSYSLNKRLYRILLYSCCKPLTFLTLGFAAKLGIGPMTSSSESSAWRLSPWLAMILYAPRVFHAIFITLSKDFPVIRLQLRLIDLWLRLFDLFFGSQSACAAAARLLSATTHRCLGAGLLNTLTSIPVFPIL